MNTKTSMNEILIKILKEKLYRMLIKNQIFIGCEITNVDLIKMENARVDFKFNLEYESDGLYYGKGSLYNDFDEIYYRIHVAGNDYNYFDYEI